MGNYLLIKTQRGKRKNHYLLKLMSIELGRSVALYGNFGSMPRAKARAEVLSIKHGWKVYVE